MSEEQTTVDEYVKPTVDDLVPIMGGGLSPDDIEKYNGTKTKVADFAVIDDEIPFDEDWNPLPEGQMRSVKRIEVVTEPIGQDALGNPITIKERFNTKIDPVSGKLGWSTHEKSNAQKFLNQLKINHFKDAKGRDVVVIKRVTGKGKAYLGINY